MIIIILIVIIITNYNKVSHNELTENMLLLFLLDKGFIWANNKFINKGVIVEFCQKQILTNEIESSGVAKNYLQI